MPMIPESDLQALRQSFYNTLALLFIAGVLATGYAVYYVLEAFLKPLLWAFTVGICLHPFKSLLTQYLRRWLKTMDKSGSPLIVASLILPLQCMSSTAEILTEKIQSYGKFILVFAVSIPLFQLLYFYGPFTMLLSFCHSVILFIYSTLGWFSTFWVATFLLGYVLLVIFYWTPTTAPWLKAFSIPIWIILILYLGGISGPVGVPLFVGCIVLMLIGLVSYAKEHSIAIFSMTHLSSLISRPRTGSTDSSGTSNSSVTTGEEAADAPVTEENTESTAVGDFGSSSRLETHTEVVSEEDEEDQVPDSTAAEVASSQESSPPVQDESLVENVNENRRPSGPTLFRLITRFLQGDQQDTGAVPTTENASADTQTSNLNNAGGLHRQSSHPRSGGTRYHHCNYQQHQQVTVSRTIVRRAFICLFWAHIVVYMWSNVWFVLFLPCAWVVVMSKRLFSKLATSSTQTGTTPPSSGDVVDQFTRSKSENSTSIPTPSPPMPSTSAPSMSSPPTFTSQLSTPESIGKEDLCQSWLQWISNHLGDRKQALAPAPVRGLVRLLLKADSRIRQFLDSSLDYIVSIFVILLVTFGTLLVLMFLAFQIHRESIHLVFMTSNLLNSTIHSDALSWIPHKESFISLFDSMAGNAYVMGREWITKKLDQLLAESNPYNKARIEEQVLQVWDLLYQRLMLKNDSVLAESFKSGSGEGGLGKMGGELSRRGVVSLTLFNSQHNLWETLRSVELLDMRSVVEFVRENLGLFSTVVESLWIVLKSNLNLGLSLLSTLLSLLFGGGSALLNFFLSSLIFLTALCYLLAYSGEVYLPVQFLISLSPYADRLEHPSQSKSSGGPNESTPNKLRTVYFALAAAVSGVFAATLKMALFYGFYTVFTHNLVGVNLVVIPAVLAAILGAVPFIGTYWATLPAVMELFLRQDYILAVVLFGAHLLPTYVVDTAIYSEIEGAGHPYMTGLAIAGGVYCFGLAGAIVGPMLLCLLLAAVNVYSAVLSPSHSATDSSMQHEIPSVSRTDAPVRSSASGHGKFSYVPPIRRRLSGLL